MVRETCLQSELLFPLAPIARKEGIPLETTVGCVQDRRDRGGEGRKGGGGEARVRIERRQRYGGGLSFLLLFP